jgi:protein disulfide-isomerase A4
LNAVGLGDSGLEHNVLVFGVDGKKYPMNPDKYDEELEENLVAFLEDIGKGFCFFNRIKLHFSNLGKVKPYVKSQPLPKDDKNPVRTVVASNFDKIVKDESKDVLIEFYAPW